MDKSWGHYAKWEKSDKDKYCMFSLHVESKKIWTQRNRVAWWLLGTRGRENGKVLAKGYQLPAMRNSGVLIYSMVNIINNTALYTYIYI